MKKDFLKKSVIPAILLVTACWLTGCTKEKENKESSPPPQDGVTIRIGILPEQNLFSQKQRFEPLAAYLGKRTGAKIDLVILSRYGNIIDNFLSGNLDGAFFGSFTAALALRKLHVEPLARPEWLDGHSTYCGLIFVRKDSGIKDAADMRGKRFAFVDKATTAGWLLPLFYFQEHGIKDYKSWFGETYFSGTHEDSIYDVLDKKADVGAAKNTVYYRLAATDPRITNELEILARSPDVPENGLLVRQDLDASLKNSLRATLLDMDQDEEGREILHNFGAIRFIPTSEEDYRPVFEYTARIGLDLAKYNYQND